LVAPTVVWADPKFVRPHSHIDCTQLQARVRSASGWGWPQMCGLLPIHQSINLVVFKHTIPKSFGFKTKAHPKHKPWQLKVDGPRLPPKWDSLLGLEWLVGFSPPRMKKKKERVGWPMISASGRVLLRSHATLLGSQGDLIVETCLPEDTGQSTDNVDKLLKIGRSAITSRRATVRDSLLGPRWWIGCSPNKKERRISKIMYGVRCIMVVLVNKQRNERKKELVRTNPKASFTREGLLSIMKHQLPESCLWNQTVFMGTQKMPPKKSFNITWAVTVNFPGPTEYIRKFTDLRSTTSHSRAAH
jgi:hypothetical protein